MEFVEELRFFKEQLGTKERVEVPENTKNIVIAGMGGSGLAGKIFSELYSGLPVYLADGYELPEFVSDSTLVIAISYSGNTEETLTMAKDAKKKNAHLVTISSRGELSEQGDQRIKVPRSDLQPRSSTPYLLLPLLNGFNLISPAEVSNSYKLLDALDKDSKECESHANALVNESLIPVIYGSTPYRSVAYQWKIQFNETSKLLAYANSFPELNHNDTTAIATSYKKEDLYFFVFDSETKRINDRIRMTQEITGSKFNIVRPKGASRIEKMFYLLHYGSYVSYYAAKLRRVDPASVPLIEKLKKGLKDTPM